VPKANIAIIGGGIGGVAAALALHQAGVDAVVYERASQSREIGAGMMLWPNATRVLRELGVLETLAAQCSPNNQFHVRSSSGRILMNIGLGKFDVPAICTRRSDLLSALLTALPPESVRLAHDFHHLEQSSDKVRVYFENGIVKEHDAVIGADGMRSRVRAQLFGDSPPIYRGYHVWRGIAHYEGAAVFPGANSETWGNGKRFGILSIGQGCFTWYATANVPSDHPDARHGRKLELQKAFAGWHEPIADLIAATDENGIMKHGAYDRPPLRHWTDRMVTLLGDAAHPCTPNLGQGGCMALEDALALAKCVVRDGSLEAALLRYESLRRPRTTHIQQRSLLMGRIGQWENSLFVTGRKTVTRLLPARLFEYNLRRVYSYQT